MVYGNHTYAIMTLIPIIFSKMFLAILLFSCAYRRPSFLFRHTRYITGLEDSAGDVGQTLLQVDPLCCRTTLGDGNISLQW